MIKQASIIILKIVISATLLYLLVSKVGGKIILQNIRLLHPAAFLAAAALYIIAAYVSTLRWKLLVPFQSRTSRLFSIYMIGSFFNTYLPGVIGGDAVKAYYLNKELQASGTMLKIKDKNEQSSVTTIIASVFMDRYIGLASLLFLGLAAFPFGISYLERASLNWPVIWIVPAAAGAFISISIVIFKFRVGERLKFLLKAYQYLHFYITRKKILLKAFFYSILVQLFGILAVFIIARGLSLDISFLSLLIFLPIIVLITALPLSISGIGLREGAFIFLLGSTGVPAEKSMTLSIIWFLSVFAAGLWGLLEYLRFKTVFGREEKKETFQVP
ncbi:MAG: flippase-like domain-containing protein [Nitrospirae bacterium]|nr:flippase-like domain-containing protein [Nitrospirota bacterium]